MNIAYPWRVVLMAALGGVLAACAAGAGGPAMDGRAPLSCDNSLETVFAAEPLTSIVLVKSFKKGDVLALGATPTPGAQVAANDVCLVKLMVGPGNPGPAGVPSTSAGIGIEVWLPSTSNWNERIHALGGLGYQGGPAGSAAAIASTAAAAIAGGEGAVSSTTDTGHPDGASGGAFAMNPDGTTNTKLWTDFASRSIREQALKTKTLAVGFYGKQPKYAYWEGGSTGGRQGLHFAQNHPDDFDGIIANYPAIGMSRFVTAELYPQLVFQRDLGGKPPTTAQLDLVSNAAINACDLVGGRHLGYILDPSACTYDPTRDAAVLCASSGGTNSTAACVTTAQAAAINKIWFGMTADGSAPAPSADNGWAAASLGSVPSGTMRWFGLARGTSLHALALLPRGLNGLASPAGPFQIASDYIALVLQNSALAGPNFRNASGNGRSLWKDLSYAQLSDAYDRGLVLQPAFGHINTDNPDLSAFKQRGGKMLTWHGLADEFIMPQGTVNYYNRVVAQQGGHLATVQSFYRLYLVPAQGHGTPNGTSNTNADPPTLGASQMYELLTNWVENGVAPEDIVLHGPAGKSRPICVYPKKAEYTSGDPNVAASYRCS